MSKRIAVRKYPGVFYSELKCCDSKGKPDRSYCFCFNNNGKKFWKSVGLASRGVTAAYANIARNDFLNSLMIGKTPHFIVDKKSCNMDKAYDAWLTWSKGEGRVTKFSESYYNNHIRPIFGLTPISMITLDHLDTFKAELMAKVSPGTVKLILGLMRRIINHAIKRKIWQGTNPLANLSGFTMPKVDNKCERFLTPNEAKLLLDDLEERSQVMHDMAFVSLYTGMRLTEIMRLKGMDINEASKTAIVTAKGGLRQPVLLGDEALEVIMKNRRSPEEPVFRDRNGDRFYGVAARSSPFLKAIKACHLNDHVTDRRHKVTFHTFRHTYASWLAQAGVGIYDIMRLMRHSSIEMTMRYAHLIPDRQREYLKILPQTILGGVVKHIAE